MKKFQLFFICAVASLLVSSCSTDLTRLNTLDYPKVIPFFEPIYITFNNKSELLDVQLQRAYTAIVDTSIYPMESCRGNISIQATVLQDHEKEGSLWALPLTIFPLWPAMPVDETWEYHLTAHIFCNGTLTYKAEFKESEKISAFWYGRLRSDLVNKASQSMHQRLLHRLKYELQLNRKTDLNANLS